jgi:hypothetical protein
VYPHAGRITTLGWVWATAWAASAVFHSRDFWLTERFDYFLGNAALAWMAYVGVVRAGWKLLGLERAGRRCGLILALVGLLAAHFRAGWRKINYARNVVLMVGLLVAHTFAWTYAALASPRPHNWMLFVTLSLTYVAGALEMFDFPPVLGSLDAHALWHAATPPLALLFYAFLRSEMKFEFGQALREHVGHKRS